VKEVNMFGIQIYWSFPSKVSKIRYTRTML